METGTLPSALFLSPEAPYPLAGGGALRSASLLEYLGRRYKLDAILFREPGAPDPSGQIPPQLLDRVLILDLPRHSRHPLSRLARTAARFARGVAPLPDRFSGFASHVREFVRGRHYQLALIEHSWCAPYWEQVAPNSKSVVLDLHNLESVLMARRAEAAGFPAAGLFRRFERVTREMERVWFPRFSWLLAASEPDAKLIQAASPASRVLAYPNALPFTPAPDAAEEHVVAFSGNLEYDPNSDAVRHFHRRIWPLLRSRWPKLIWRLIGKHPEAVRGRLQGDARIELTGPPDDAIKALGASQVVVVPVRIASGTRVKILEAWAAGRAVVSTTLGAEGLPARDGVNLLISDRPEEFARAVSRLLESGELRHRLGAAGRRLYEADFTWEAAWSKLAAAGI